MEETRNVFDQIAPSWYNYRHWSRFRRELETLATRWQRGKLLNLGCAHGPDFLPFHPGFELHGVDFSTEMLKLAGEYARKFHFPVNLSQADVRQLPYENETFDWAISVATYHHLKGSEARQEAMTELKRVLKPQGEAFITVWNKWQPQFWLRGKEIMVPWHQKGQTWHRYYYLFSYPEMKRLVEGAGFTILKTFPEYAHRFPVNFFSRNICLLVSKAG